MKRRRTDKGELMISVLLMLLALLFPCYENIDEAAVGLAPGRGGEGHGLDPNWHCFVLLVL